MTGLHAVLEHSVVRVRVAEDVQTTVGLAALAGASPSADLYAWFTWTTRNLDLPVAALSYYTKGQACTVDAILSQLNLWLTTRPYTPRHSQAHGTVKSYVTELQLLAKHADNLL